jgi:hypothetical protein
MATDAVDTGTGAGTVCVEGAYRNPQHPGHKSTVELMGKLFEVVYPESPPDSGEGEGDAGASS